MAIDPNIKKKADDIRNKVYGREVRESLASGLEEMSADVIENESRQSVVEGRQDSVESQWQVVSDEMTDKDVISAPEIIAARNGESNLKARLDKEHQQVIKQAKRDVNLNTIKRNIPLVSFVDDDGNRAVLSKLLPLAQEYDIPFTVCMPSDSMLGGSGLSAEELKTLQDEHGFEIASHGKTHSPINDEMSEEQQFIEVYESWRVMREHGLNIETLVYPYGQYTDYSKRIASMYYKAGVSTDTLYNDTPIRTYSLGRFAFPGNDRPLDYYKSRVDEAVANNSWLIFMLHCGQASHDEEQQQILEQLIQYIQSINVDIVNVTDGIDISGNIIDINQQEIFWAKDGKNNIRDTEYNRVEHHTGLEKHDGNSNPRDFPIHKLSIDPVYSGESQQSLPASTRRGTLITINNGTMAGSQIYYSTRYMYYRSSNADNTTWDEWYRVLSGIESIVSADFGTLSAGERKEMTVRVPRMVQGQHIVVTPRSTLLSNIEFRYLNAGGGNLRLVMHNHSDTINRTIGLIEFNLLAP